MPRYNNLTLTGLVQMLGMFKSDYRQTYRTGREIGAHTVCKLDKRGTGLSF